MASLLAAQKGIERVDTDNSLDMAYVLKSTYKNLPLTLY